MVFGSKWKKEMVVEQPERAYKAVAYKKKKCFMMRDNRESSTGPPFFIVFLKAETHSVDHNMALSSKQNAEKLRLHLTPHMPSFSSSYAISHDIYL